MGIGVDSRFRSSSSSSENVCYSPLIGWLTFQLLLPPQRVFYLQPKLSNQGGCLPIFFFQTGDYSVPYKAWLPFKTLGVCVGGGALIHILRFPTDSSSSIRPPRSQSLFSEHLGPWLQPALLLTLSPSCSRPYVKLEDLCYPNKNITEVLLQSKERDIILASLQAMHYTWTDSQRVQPNPALSR